MTPDGIRTTPKSPWTTVQTNRTLVQPRAFKGYLWAIRGAAIGLLAALMMLVPAPPSALAMRVGGTLVNGAGQPLSSRDLHFQNCVTYDIYLSPTHDDGSFAAQLPPGCYQLRNEAGAIIDHHIYVTKYDVSVGRVHEEPTNPIAGLFEMQSIFPTLLTSPAPSTAYVFTRDTAAGLLPASAEKVPMPSSESEWLKLQAQSDSLSAANGSPAPQTSLNSPNAMSNNPPPDLSGSSNANPLFSEPSFNPQQPVATPPAGAPRASPYQ
jgi:hypothetical protein